MSYLAPKEMKTFASSSKQTSSLYLKNKEYIFTRKIFDEFPCIKSMEDVYHILQGTKMREICIKNKKYASILDYVSKKLNEFQKLQAQRHPDDTKSVKIMIEIIKIFLTNMLLFDNPNGKVILRTVNDILENYAPGPEIGHSLHEKLIILEETLFNETNFLNLI